jgi:hypothetical protein
MVIRKISCGALLLALELWWFTWKFYSVCMSTLCWIAPTVVTAFKHMAVLLRSQALWSSVYVLMQWQLFHKHFTTNPMATCLKVKDIFGSVFRKFPFNYFIHGICNCCLFNSAWTAYYDNKITWWINEFQFVAWEIFPPSRLWGPCCFLFHGCWKGWILGVKWSER